MREAITVRVCGNCLLHAANGECGDCHEESHEGGEPLSLLSPEACPGWGWEEHSEECPTFQSEGADRETECDCETDTYSTSQCGGCGSTFYGERHAMTDWVRLS